LVFSSISILVVLIEWFYYTRNKMRNRKKGLNYLCNSVEIYNQITYLKELVEPSLTLLAMLIQSKSVGSIALILGTYNVLGNISRIPRMGSHVFMSGKVLRTITEFFFSYIFVIFGYTITFHIAFHDKVETFSNLGDSLIKVMTMLLGEFDYSDNFVDKSSDWMPRIFFVLFLVTMCITLMNLIVGLAIGDIKKMRKNANVYKQIGTLSGIKIVDEILVFFQHVPCLTKWIKQRRECNHFKVFLDLQEGRYCNAQKLHITDSKTQRSWSYGASRDTLKKVIDILKTTTHEGCYNEETPPRATSNSSTDELVKIVERMEKRIEGLEAKLDLQQKH